MLRPEIPESVRDGLKAIRAGMHLRWNATGHLLEAGTTDVAGKVITEPVYEPRWEVWDVDPQNVDYLVMKVQNPDGTFRQPDQRLVDIVAKGNPERWGGNVHLMVNELIDEPEALRDAGTRKDSDDLIDAWVRWCEWAAKPKSAAGLSYRGERIGSGRVLTAFR